MNRISVIRKTDPPDSRSDVSRSEPSVSVSDPSSRDSPQSTAKGTQDSLTVSGPGPSTGVISRPGCSSKDIHKNITRKEYNSGELFDYFVGGNVSESEDDDNIDIDIDNSALQSIDNVVHDNNDENFDDIESDDND